MTTRFKGMVPITVIVAYAPTARAPGTEKAAFYDQLKQEARKANNRGLTLIIGDFNARIQKRITEAETSIGNFTFDKESTRPDVQHEMITDNRERFIKYSEQYGVKVMNTFFKKQENNAHPKKTRATQENHNTTDRNTRH